ncbi:beta strand repeat-containing protein [Pseudomonadota bacterium]
MSLLVAQILGTPLLAQAAVVEVTSNLDNGTNCTLREAIVSINNGSLETGCSNSGGAFGSNDQVTFDGSVSGGTITLTAGQIDIDEDVAINPGGIRTTVDGNGVDRLFRSNVAGLQIALEQLRLTGGQPYNSHGGAISITGAGAVLTLTNCQVTGNTASNSSGGGIYSSGATVTLSNTTVSGNYANPYGGGVYARGGSNLLVTNSLISGNTVYISAGGVKLDGSTATLTNSTVTRNSTGFSGGGIAAYWSSHLTLNNVNVSMNTADTQHGGGIYFRDSTAVLSGTTIYRNSAATHGGGFDAQNSNVTLLNSTVSGNTAPSSGGIHAHNGGTLDVVNSTIADNGTSNIVGGSAAHTASTITLTNTIVADAESGPDCVLNGASVTAGATSIIENDGCSTSAMNVDPAIRGLARNGGPTLTHALLTGSPAINSGNNTNCGTGKVVEFDQRGASRNDGACDIGAFELSTASGGSIQVTSSLDDGTDCTLREAIVSVNNGVLETGCSNSGGSLGLGYTTNQITFHPSVQGSTITLSGSQIQIGTSVNINPGGSDTTIDAYGGSRIFFIDKGARVELNHLVLTGGNDSGYEDGGAIFGEDCGLYLSGSTITGNTSYDDGGGIFVWRNSSVDLLNSTVSGNTANDFGGGINAFESEVSLTNSTISGNTASTNDGGGVGVFFDRLTLQSSYVQNNGAQRFGGGIALDNSHVTLVDSTVSGNTAAVSCGGINGYGSHVALTGSGLLNNTAVSGSGGGMCGNNATLTFENSSVSGNSVVQYYGGGGIVAAENALVTVSNSTLSNNSVAGIYGDGGAITFYSGTSVTITNSTVSGNRVSGNYSDGGGISAKSGTSLTITGSTISGNNATGTYGDGGGIFTVLADVSIDKSTISGNSAFDDGGGVYLYRGGAALTNSTISGNTAVDSGAGVAVFGDTNVSITSSTISGNTVTDALGVNGPGLLLYQYLSFTPSVSILNTIIGNSSGGYDCDTDGTATFSANSSLVESDDCGLTNNVNGNIIGPDPQLGTLLNNGGATETHALLSGSMAIGNGNNTDCGSGKTVDTDQRDFPRNDGSCDIGAFEFTALEFGDAPPPYPTLATDDGARHMASGLTLGAVRDTENDGLPLGTALGDDNDGSDDEDGVTFGGVFGTGLSNTVTVTVSAAGMLDGWIDFDDDGNWLDAGEQIFASQSLNAGANVFSVPVPGSASVGGTFARFRVSSAGGLAPSGYSPDGEVEDYALTIEDGTTDTDTDGLPDVYEDNTPGLDAGDPDDAEEDEDSDGLTNLAEFTAGSDVNDPDTDGDGIGDAKDNDPLVSSNLCSGNDAVLLDQVVLSGEELQCAAENSIEVQESVDVNIGGRLDLISRQVKLRENLSIPTGAEVSIDSSDPTPP